MPDAQKYFFITLFFLPGSRKLTLHGHLSPVTYIRLGLRLGTLTPTLTLIFALALALTLTLTLTQETGVNVLGVTVLTI